MNSSTMTRTRSTIALLTAGLAVAVFGTATFASNSPSATAQSFLAQGNGLSYAYFANSRLEGQPQFSDVDPLVDFNWGNEGVAAGFPSDDFSVRWTGDVEAARTGGHTFAVAADDGVRLWVNSTLLIDTWTVTGATQRMSAPLQLVTGQTYGITLEYREIAGPASVSLSWTPPGQGTEVIPQRFLYPTAQDRPPATAPPTPTQPSPTSPPPTSPPGDVRTLSYEASSENFANPERGYAYQNDPPWPAGGVKWDFCGQGNNFTAYNYDQWNDPLDPAFIAQRRALGQSVIQSRYHLAAFRTQDLTASYLAFLHKDFATARAGGIKLSVRFAYNYPFGGPDASLTQILRHLDQLKPVLEQNKDVIAYLEAGFVGCWGEWHNSSNGLDQPDTGAITPAQTTILNKILQVLPADRMIAVRYPRHVFSFFGNTDLSPIAPLTESQAYSGSARARIGHQDDCFVCSDTNGGTYLRQNVAAEKAFLQENNLFAVQQGEPGPPESIDPAVPANVNSPRASCDAIRAELRDNRWSVLGLFDVGSPTSVISRWERDGCAPEFQRNLGYRFRLVSSSVPTTATAGQQLNLSITMANDGYARPFNPRNVEVVLREQRTGDLERITVPTGKDARLWLPGPAQTLLLPISVTVPASIPNGTYDVLLNLPDPEPTLNHRAAYSIRFANTDTWEDATGYNRLNSSVNVGSTTPPPQPARAIRLMPLGDSLTEGAGPVEGNFQSYRGHLYNSLIAGGYQVDMVGPNRWFTTASQEDGDHAGWSGFTIGPDSSGSCTRPTSGDFAGCPPPHFNLYENVDPWLATYQPDVITLMIGVNDQFKNLLAPGQSGPYRDVSAEEAPARLEALVAKIQRLAPNTQLVLGGLSRVGYVSDTPNMAALRAKARALGERSATDNITFADVWSAELQSADFTDGLHYSDSGAAKVAAAWLPGVKSAIDLVRTR